MAVNRVQRHEAPIERIDTEAVPEILTIEDGRKKYTPLHAGQLLAWRSIAEIVAVVAGWQSGKTVIGPPWLLREISRTGAEDYLACSPTFPLLQKKLLPELKKAFKGLAVFKAADRCFVFTDSGCKALGRVGPITVWLGYAENPDSLESATYGAVLFDEPGAAPEQSYHTLRSRLAIHRGRMLLTSRPYTHNWYKRLIWDRRLDETSNIECVNFKSTDNPAFPKDFYEQRRLEMPAWKHAMLYDGLFTRPAGAIFDCFESALHVKRLERQADAPVYTGHDFGTANMAAVMLEERDDGLLYIFDTYRAGGRSIKDHAKRIVAKAGGPHKIVGSYGGSWSEDEYRQSFDNEGFPIHRPPYKYVDPRIMCFYRELKLNRLVIDPDCKELIEEIEQYTYELDVNEEPTDKIAEKAKYHRLDAACYIVSQLRQISDMPDQTADQRHRREKEDEWADPELKIEKALEKYRKSPNDVR